MADIEGGRMGGVSVAIGDEVLELPADGARAAEDVLVLAERDDPGAPMLPAQATLLPDGTVHLPLRHPRTLKFREPGATTPREQGFDHFTFRRLTGADMRAIGEAAEADRSVVAIARATDTRLALMHLLFDRLDGADVIACGDVLGFLLGSGRKTGR